MPHYRSNKNQANYEQNIKKTDPSKCPFCHFSPQERKMLETENFTIVENIFPYDIWDARHVADHLMIVPKLHTDTLNALSKEAQLEYMQLMSDYESRGYDVYARSPHSNIKSVVHQHTHLIKTTGPKIQGLSYTESPYNVEIIGE